MAPTVTIEYTESKVSGVIMGKSRKVSKGPSSGFVPDYRHAVETMAESEGFGSSGRVDMEMAVSENSYAPKRNRNDRDRFSVPLQYLPLSKLSRTDRKDLELRLRNELDQVRILQRRITSTSTSVGMNSVVHSPASDIHSYSDGLKRPPLERSAADKKRPLGKNGPRTKGAAGSKHIEAVKPSVPSDANKAMLIQKCDALLKLMMKHEDGWVFSEPVDVVKLNIPEYRTIIKHPMDFGTIMKKLHAGLYPDISGFADDVRLTFNNATTFNPPGHDVHLMANTMSKFFEVRWKHIEKKITSNVGQLLAPRLAVSLQTNTPVPVPVPPSKKAKSTPTPVENVVLPENKVKPVLSAVDKTKIMSAVDRNKLSADLESLIEELPESIIDFLKRSCSNASKANEDEAEKGSEDEIEIDVDALDDDTLFTLRKLLDDYLLDKQKNQAKENNTVVLQNVLGLSTSFPDTQKGNDLVDEEVDIGGDDLLSSFPPVEIDKDTTLKNSKNNSSSGSSSNSDSDSGSSSSGDSDVDKDTTSPGPPKDTGVHVEPTTDAGAEETLNCIAGQDTEPVMAPTEANIQREAESVPPERIVSPEKLYRAALLRSRFADTIIKAQEKTLEQSDKLDPEKLRLEREDLERRRREEKARLQAEAKAAEEARKKAEEAAAVEAKKKRELEREAARQALQKMEKTVDINENCQFMGDLEMFRSAPDEHLASLIEETSPNHSQDGLGSFNFRGGSPLMEKLGLYRKKDDDEEEDLDAIGIPETAREPEPEPEEGEID